MIEFCKEDIEDVMKITGLDEKKAEKLFCDVAKDIDGTLDDLCSFDVIDIIQDEYKAKANGKERHFVTSAEIKPKKERKPKERKVDTTKVELLEMLKKGLIDNDIEVTTENEVKIHFNYLDVDYTVTLTKHRKK